MLKGKKTRKVLATAYVGWLGRIAWRRFVTLTFDPKRQYAVGALLAEKEALRWCQELSRLCRCAVEYLIVLERTASGLWHAHVLLAGGPPERVLNKALSIASASWELRNGRCHETGVHDSPGAVGYLCKEAGLRGNVVPSDGLSRLLDLPGTGVPDVGKIDS